MKVTGERKSHEYRGKGCGCKEIRKQGNRKERGETEGKTKEIICQVRGGDKGEDNEYALWNGEERKY